MKKLWLLFIGVVGLSFAVLLWIGSRIYQEKPPIPEEVVSSQGQVLLTKSDILNGQDVWRALGGMELGSVWGHGSYLAPDWTADYLHREAVFLLDFWARAEKAASFAALDEEKKAALEARLKGLIRKNTFDPATGFVAVDPVRVDAFENNYQYFADVFTNGRKEYSIPNNAQPDQAKLRSLTAFFFWTSWAASTNRPGENITYTHNFPHEPLVGNVATGEVVVWTGVSVIMLLAGIGGLLWWYVSRKKSPPTQVPAADPFAGLLATPSQKAVMKYFYTVGLIIAVQILTGIIAAHYGVEGNEFYGIPLAKWLPYSLVRTWHVQLGLFWIATAWLGAGLFIGPLVTGEEPKYQRLGVNILFGALLVVVAGSLAGEWLSIMNKMSPQTSFFWGHQGYEYIDLGRIWQAALLAGLLLWLFLVARSIIPAMKKSQTEKGLLGVLLISTVAIALFYGAGLAWGQHTHLSIVEYWRWWVVHLWVEGFFEVFATVVIAFFFTRLKLIDGRLAAEASLISAIIYLTGGVIGTCHHLYFAGTPTVALAFGAVFSALEVVPLILISFAAVEDLSMTKKSEWVRYYRWPIYFFVAVAFWNFLGAGIFGFMINPPVALYFMQGLNTTPVHSHAALFGVYGILGMGLILFSLKALRPDRIWKTTLLAASFWGINIGLFAMTVFSLLPVGLLQTWASVEHSYWYARSAEFMHRPIMQTLRWMRVPGDVVFAVGALGFVFFVFACNTRLLSNPVVGRKDKQFK